MICVDVRSGSRLNIPLKLCLLNSSCTVRTNVGLPKPMGLGREYTKLLPAAA